MTRGYTQQSQAALSHFGKHLTRRAKSHCEMCDAQHTPLHVFEVPPTGESPDLEQCAYLCHTCIQHFEDPKFLDSSHWRCLHNSAWSQVPAVQVMSVLQLQLLAGRDWADELREHLYLEPDVEDWLAKIH